MKNSEIKFSVLLDDQHVPEKIVWDATDKPSDGPTETRAIAISLWDHDQFNTMRMDLWTKEMTVNEMRKFCVDTLGAMSESIKSATGDTVMAEHIQELCSKLVKHVEENPM